MVHLHDPLPHAERITLFGAGWTGIAAAQLLHRLGKRVTLTDTRDEARLRAALDALQQEHGAALPPGVTLRCGAPHHHGDAQAVILTQSVKHHDPAVLAAQAAGLPVIPEVELAASALHGSPIHLLAIGGTDGKTTPTQLAYQLAAAQGAAWIGGNSWDPLSAVVLRALDDLRHLPTPTRAPVLVAEISAFQLPPWHRFTPRGAAVTNVAEDHVDEYFNGSWDAYVAAKRALTDGLPDDGWAVLNADDPTVARWEPRLLQRGVRVLRTSLAARPVYNHPDAAFRSNGELRLRLQGQEIGLIHQSDLRLVGDHNAENVLSAVALLAPLGLDLDVARETLRGFKAPHHRLEFVRHLRGVDLYDDSKATNVHASLAGIAAFGQRPLVAIVGGVDKGLDLEPWVEALRARARAVVAIGQLRQRLLRDFAHRLPDLRVADSMEAAVALALEAAAPGDVVLLTPACSSFDMFQSYAQRGQVFQEIVRSWNA